ncbi:Aste57867_24732 [Aphanomyces stellatus]|uniref:Aste57867_24732 protein n=1 Tax=Aphanomyces stellatus TaxID=120398 RepID=A0A485LR74_9STRA|nr:hypothetical protein As57867_024654 [Aphanomyces stellatus]VFU01368.1 Aste57867_24732 [Aphanomyces stellatus]
MAAIVSVLATRPLTHLISSFQDGISEAVRRPRSTQPAAQMRQAGVASRGDGVNIHMDELESIMAARHVVLVPLLDSNQASHLYHLLATDAFARALIAEYAAFYGRLDLFQAALQHAAQARGNAAWNYIANYAAMSWCYRPTTGSLHQLAAYHGHACILDALRDNADANYSIENARGGPEEYSDIHVAAERGNVAHLNYILDNIEQHGRQCTKPSCTNKRPHVNYAIGAPLLDTMAADYAARGSLAMVQWLDGNRSEKCSPRALSAAAASGQVAIAEYLVQHRLVTAAAPALVVAASHGQLSVVQVLRGSYPHLCVAKPLLVAAKASHDEVVRYLDVNRCDCCHGISLGDLVKEKKPAKKRKRH